MAMSGTDLAGFISDIIAGVIAGGAFVVSWVTRRSTTRHQEFEALTRSVVALEERARHIPGGDDMRRIYGKLDELAREVAELHGSSMGTQRMVETINRHLLERDK